MNRQREHRAKSYASRRGFLTKSAGLIATASAGLGAGPATEALAERGTPDTPAAQSQMQTEAFWGAHQGGIVTPAQSHTYFATFDLTTDRREDVAELLRAWTIASARMAEGQTAQPLGDGLKPVAVPNPHEGLGKGADSYAASHLTGVAADSGEAFGLPPARLTVTFGFGLGLFIKDGKDRYGLAVQRPAALVDMPRFAGDQLVAAHTGGDLSVQACADDPQIAFHAVRQLARLAAGAAKVRWVQTAFIANFSANETPRNLMGFKDGTVNPAVGDAEAMAKFVWVGEEGPGWMRGGSYLVVRRIRIALEHWDRMKTAFQEQTVGRHKYSGAPLGKTEEFDALDLDAVDRDGNPVIPENAHVRLAAAASNDGARFLRRPYSYNDGVNFTAERWPPWRQGLEYDAGLFFISYQRDPRTGFIKIYDTMSKLDMMNQFVTHVGSGLFACPSGTMPGGFIGQGLFED
ncbi:MAG TPA: Dyp-type peroxidase [Xanthobacteraceae bacterium]|nr:Dyp-type peroxidase [Xanthobacteraceae bacterium]